MQPDELYHEEIGSFWGRLAIAVMFAVSLLFLILFFWQRAYGAIGSDPAPDWFYLVMFAFFLAFGLLVLNFSSLTISATTRGLTAAYGHFRHSVAWEDIAGVELDQGSALKQYGGYGIRYGWRNGRLVLVYNTMGNALILLDVNKGNYRYFGFSTKRPDEVMSLIRSYKK